MSPANADILLHPIRLRIVLAMGAEHPLTTAAIAERLPDIAHATLYRHVAVLAEAGVLEVIDERRVRGGVERTYALVAEAARLGAADVADMEPEELLRGFIVFAGSLIEAFSRYTADPEAQPEQDLLGYRQAALWLDEVERAALVERLTAALGPVLQNGPTATRQRVLLSTVLIPDLAASSVAEPDEAEDRPD